MGTYATVADLRARSEVPDAAPPSDAELEELIADAEDLVDRLVGARAASSTTGRKWNVAAGTILAAAAIDALKRATVLLAVSAYVEPGAFNPPLGGTVSGPDFTVTNPAGATPRAQSALRQAAGLLDSQRLRVLAARARA